VLLTSPSGEVELSVMTDEEGRMTYTVRKGGVTMVESSPLGLATTTHDLTAGVTMSSSSVRTVRESYTMLVGKRRDREVDGNEIVVPLTDAKGARAELILRAHEDGVAFRYHLLGEGVSRRAPTSSPQSSSRLAPRPTQRALRFPHFSS
jgi:actin-like ATPase involved in cell morphogenesis